MFELKVVTWSATSDSDNSSLGSISGTSNILSTLSTASISSNLLVSCFKVSTDDFSNIDLFGVTVTTKKSTEP